MTSLSLLTLAIQEAEQKDFIIKNLFEEFGNFGNMIHFFVNNIHTAVQNSLKEQNATNICLQNLISEIWKQVLEFVMESRKFINVFKTSIRSMPLWVLEFENKIEQQLRPFIAIYEQKQLKLVNENWALQNTYQATVSCLKEKIQERDLIILNLKSRVADLENDNFNLQQPTIQLQNSLESKELEFKHKEKLLQEEIESLQREREKDRLKMTEQKNYLKMMICHSTQASELKNSLKELRSSQLDLTKILSEDCTKVVQVIARFAKDHETLIKKYQFLKEKQQQGEVSLANLHNKMSQMMKSYASIRKYMKNVPHEKMFDTNVHPVSSTNK